MLSVVVFLLSLQLASSLTADPQLSQKYSSKLSLDEAENYWLYWSVDHNAGTITFAVQVNTPGWIGLGISPDGKMPDSDIVTGWVKDGEGYLQDRMSTGRTLPAIDPIQDVQLLSSSETNQITTLEFKRKVRACEPNDRSIDIGTSRLIWAYNAEDPDSPDSLKFHEQNVGWRSVNLLDGRVTDVPMPDDVMHVDAKMDNIYVPPVETTYWCKTFTLPKFSSEANIIGYDPVIQAGNEGFVHHVVIYRCNNITGFRLDHDAPCGANMPDEVSKCRGASPVAAWAVGGRGERFPSDVGLPFGGDSGLYTILIETHYDNPKKYSGHSDSSGIRFYYTRSERKYKASSISFGHQIGVNLFLPAEQKAIKVSTLCPSDCTKAGLPDDGVTVLYTLLHAHTAGRALRLRHFRNGIELPEIARNDNYDFNYQDTVRPVRETKIYPGDLLVTECTYSTVDRSANTFAGLGTQEEMCFAYLTVYPAPVLQNCVSMPTTSVFLDFIRQAGDNGWAQFKGLSIPDLYVGLDTLNVSAHVEAQTAYYKYLSNSDKTVFCSSTSGLLVPPWTSVFKMPQGIDSQPTETPVETSCDGLVNGERSLKVFSWLLLFGVIQKWAL